MTTYAFSTNEERFSDTCEAKSIEEAIGIAKDELCLEEGQSFFVGLRAEIRPEQYVNAFRILEEVGEQIYERVGECCEAWPEVTNAQIADLEARLQATFKQWMIDTNCEPSFFAVEQVREITTGDGDE